VVQQTGQRAGTTRPSYVFELTPEVEQLLSRAYIPLLTQLARVFADGLPAHQMDMGDLVAALKSSERRVADVAAIALN
jgi:hypothetical protein